MNLSDLAKIGDAILGHDIYSSISKAIQKEISAHSSEIAALSSVFQKIGSVKLPPPPKPTGKPTDKPTGKPVAHLT